MSFSHAAAPSWCQFSRLCLCGLPFQACGFHPPQAYHLVVIRGLFPCRPQVFCSRRRREETICHRHASCAGPFLSTSRFLPPSHQPELGHMATSSCSRVWSVSGFKQEGQSRHWVGNQSGEAQPPSHLLILPLWCEDFPHTSRHTASRLLTHLKYPSMLGGHGGSDLLAGGRQLSHFGFHTIFMVTPHFPWVYPAHDCLLWGHWSWPLLLRMGPF